MRLVLLLLLLTACAASSMREKAVVVEFDPDRFERAARLADFEHRFAVQEALNTGACFLPTPTNATRWHAVSDKAATPRAEETSTDVVWLPEIELPSPDRGSEWNLDMYGVTLTRIDESHALRVETRFGDWGGMERVVAWLEAYGGKRLR